MMKENYGLRMKKELDAVSNLRTKPSLLLQVCCAPCSSYVLEYLSFLFDITLFFYNPNISPKEEFDLRLAELQRFTNAAGYHGISIQSPPYDSAAFYDRIRGMEDLPEGSKRCRICYELRLRKTAKAAKEGSYDYFCTTLSISPYKNAGWLNEIGLSLEKEYGVRWLCSDFKKNDGYKRSIALSKEYGLYRQDYCGCIFSKEEAKKRRASEESEPTP